ncbi:MAG: nucleotidyl transferase AbiEii/AbiGii toxin family protein [archaeon]
MIDKNNIREVEKRLGFSFWQAEKDYLQHLFLRELYSTVGTELVFKGGTALQKAYGLHRFSRDLDFNLKGPLRVEKAIEQVSNIFETYGLSNKLTKKENSKYSLNLLIIFDSALLKNSLTIQISKKEKTELKPNSVPITPLYADIAPYFVTCMDEREILAEKVRAIYQRTFAKDIYDLWFLVNKGIKIEKKLINKKLSLIKTKFQQEAFFGKIRNNEKAWGELREVLATYPAFTNVANDLFRMFK